MTKKQLQVSLLSFFPIILFILNVISKSLFLTAQSISIDEPFTIYHAQFDFYTITDQLKNYNNPPLFELLLHVWIKYFGIGTLSVRILPLIFASLCPVALYYFCKRYFTTTIAIVSSLLLSSSSLLLFYSHDCRVYSLFLLLCILSMHFFLKISNSENRKIDVVYFIAVNILLLYAHYFGLLILFFQFVFLIFNRRKKLINIVFYYFIALIFYLPHIYVLFSRFSESVNRGTWLQPPEGLDSLYNMLWSFSNAPAVTVMCISLVLFALIKIFAFNNFKIGNDNYFLMLYWFLFSYLGLFIVSYWVPVYISRYLLFALPAYYVLLAAIVDSWIKPRELKNSLLIIVVASFIFTLDLNPDKKHDATTASRVVHFMKDPETIVIVVPAEFLPNFAYHYNKKYFSSIDNRGEYLLLDSLLHQDNIFLMNNFDGIKPIDMKKFKKIICFTAGKNVQTDKFIENLKSHFSFVGYKSFKDNYQLSFFKTL